MLWQFKPAAGGGGGVTDHGALTGLADDDHPQYHNDARGDARYAPIASVGMTWSTVVLPVSTPVVDSTTVLHTDATVTPAKTIIAMFVSSDANELEDYHDDRMTVHATALSGQVQFDILGLGRLVGPYTIKYGVS
jgi:hypothetical protein